MKENVFGVFFQQTKRSQKRKFERVDEERLERAAEFLKIHPRNMTDPRDIDNLALRLEIEEQALNNPDSKEAMIYTRGGNTLIVNKSGNRWNRHLLEQVRVNPTLNIPEVLSPTPGGAESAQLILR
jgi:hypothetical protein